MHRVDTKVVIRRLPPYLTEEEFKSIVDPLPPFKYFRFAKPDSSLEGLSCVTVYIHFSNPNALFQFVERFDGYVFMDSKGNEGTCFVERAMNQNSPVPLSTLDMTTDTKRNTLHTRKTYQEFLQMYEKRKTALETGAEPYVEEAAVGDMKQAWEKNLEEIRAREKENQEGKSARRSALVEYMNERFARLHADRDRRLKDRNPVKDGAKGGNQDKKSELDSKTDKESKQRKHKGRNAKESRGGGSGGGKQEVKDKSTKKPLPKTAEPADAGVSALKAGNTTPVASTPTPDESYGGPSTTSEKSRKAVVVSVTSSAADKYPPRNPKRGGAGAAQHYVDEYEAYYGTGGNPGGGGGPPHQRGKAKSGWGSQYSAPAPRKYPAEQASEFVEDECGSYFTPRMDGASSSSAADGGPGDSYYHSDQYYNEERAGPAPHRSRGGPPHRGRGGGQVFYRSGGGGGGGGSKRGGGGRGGFSRGRGDGPPSYMGSRRHDT